MAKLRYVGITVALIACVAVVLIGAVVIRVAVPYVAVFC